MNLGELGRRVRLLEEKFRKTSGGECNCRTGEETPYHTAAELTHIMEHRCPAHGFRELGQLILVSVGLPLRAEDQKFCSCVRSAVREFLEGMRGPLTKDEQEKQCRAWEAEFTPEADEKFQVDQMQVKKLLLQYQRAKRVADAKSTTMPTYDKKR